MGVNAVSHRKTGAQSTRRKPSFACAAPLTSTTTTAMLRLGEKTSNQFSSLEKNVVHHRTEDGELREDLKQNAAFVFLVSFLTVFIIMLSVLLIIIRILQCVKRLKKKRYLKKYPDTIICVEMGEGLF